MDELGSNEEGRISDDNYPLRHADITANERYINYSRSIQAGTIAWLALNVGQLFGNPKRMAIQCANSIKNGEGQHPSWLTAQRWIEQFTEVNEDFQIIKSPAGLVIHRRSKAT